VQENPNISGNLLKIDKERSELLELLERCMGELHSHSTFHNLLHKVGT
jgi:hypothetical protein